MLRHSSMTVVYLTVFVDLLGFGIILPILPFYAEKFGANGFWVGAVLTAYSAAQFVAAFYLGRLSDQIGRRPILLASLVGSAASLAVMGLAGSLWVLLLSRVLAGAFGGSLTTAQAYIADVTEPEERTRYIGLLGASIGLGFVLGPAIGAGLSGFGFSTAAFVAAGIAALNFAFGFVKLPESRVERRGVHRQAGGWAGLVETFLQPNVGRIVSANFLSTLAFVGVEATFALFGQARFSLGAAGMGLIFALVGVVIVVVQGGLVGRLNARFGERAPAVTGASLIGLALLAFPFSPTLITCLVIAAILAVGQGLLSPTLPSLLSRASVAGEHGSTLGIGQSAAAAARAIGPLIAGWLFDLGIALPYVAGATLALIAVGFLAGLTIPVRVPVTETGGA